MQPFLLRQKITSLYWGIFILAISEAIIAYVQSTYLNQYFKLNFISVIFITTYILTFIIINKYPNLIARFNNLRTAVIALGVKILSLLMFIYFTNTFIIFIAFILFTISFTLIFINFDVFLEGCTTNNKTGEVRGTYFTFYNLGWLVSPFLSGTILQHLGFNFLFLLDIILTAIVIGILLKSFTHFKNHFQARHFAVNKTIKEILQKKNIKKIFHVSFILHLFYAIMVLYTPIYLNQNIGLAWSEIGIIFTIMLLPFVLLQYPAGYIADKYLGEKEMLITGLVIMSALSIAMFFINSNSLALWATILFLSRIGASLTEIMRETYFFKKVDVEDLDLINALRSITPLSYIIGPLIVGLVLIFLPLNYIFPILGLVILTGLYPAITLKDTK